MKRGSVVFVLFACCLLIAAGVSADEKKQLMPDDFLKATSVGAPAVSPDGAWIAYSVSRYNVEKKERESDIWLQPFGGGEAFQLTSMPGSESGYVWHPDSKKLAFSARRDGKSQIWVIDVRGGEARKVTDIESGASSPLWSPDGSMIAFHSTVGQRYTDTEKKEFGDVRYIRNLRFHHLGPGWDEGKRQRIFVVPAAGGVAKQLTDGPCADEGDHSMVWRPDGSEIAFVSNREPEWWNTIDTNVFAVKVADGTIRKISDNVGPDHDPAWSPDGQKIAWRASFEYNYESEDYKIVVAPAAGGKFAVLTDKLDRSVTSFAWNTRGDGFYFSASSEGSSDLWSIPADKPNAFTRITEKKMIRGWQLVADGTFALLLGTDTMAPEVHTLVNGAFKRLTTDANEFWKDYEVMPCEEIWVTTKDGARVQGWLIRPVGYKAGEKVPMVLSIHGGPHGMSSPGLNFSFQLLAHYGMAVLFTNPRGSAGYGQAFAYVIHNDWNTAPFTDLMTFVDTVVEMGVADPKKLGVTGGSYGGYMTNWVIGNTDRFAAAVSVAGLSNMASFYGTTDEQFFVEKEMGGLPWENVETYLKNSPLFHAGKMVTPTMVVHGADDWRVQPEQGRQLYVALQKVGVPSVYVEYPNEQHGVSGGTHRALHNRLMLDWFGHWLQGKDPGLATYIKPTPFRENMMKMKQVEH